MKKFVEVSQATGTQLSAGQAQLRSAGFTINSGIGRYANIDFDAKTVNYSNTPVGERVWGIGDLNFAPASTPASTPAPVDNKAYVVQNHAKYYDMDKIEELFVLNGWTISGLRSMPNINFKPDSKEITFASVASGTRLLSESSVMALLGDDYKVPAVEEVVEEAPEAEVSEDTPEVAVETEPEQQDVLGSLKLFMPKKYTHLVSAKGDGYSIAVSTDGVVEVSGDREDFAIVTK